MTNYGLLRAGASILSLVSGGAALAQDPSAATPTPAQEQATAADEPETGLAEIVVTAQKREQRLQDVPVAVTAVTPETLTKAAVETTLSLQSLVPGLNVNSSEAGFRPFLRGVGTSTAGAGNENSIATYIDNIYLVSMNAGLLNLASIQSIEVLKGPQGTLFGRNATGGVINIRTKTPSQNFGGNVSVSFDNYETLIGSGYVTGGLTDNVAADLAIYYSDQNQGYGVNLATGKEHSTDQHFAARSKLRIELGDTDSLTLAADYSKSDTSGQIHRPAPGTFTQWGGPTPAGSPPLPGGYPYQFQGGKWDIDMNPDPYSKSWFAGGSATYEHEFSWARLSSFTSYRKSKRRQRWNNGASPLPIQVAGWVQPEEQFSQEFQLSALQSSPVQWILGAYYLDAAVENDPFMIGGLNPNPPFLGGVNQLQFRWKQTIKSPALYAQVTAPVEALGDTNVTAGLRYTIDKRKLVGHTEIVRQAVPGFPVPMNDPADIRSVVNPVDASKTYRTFTWRLGIDHHITRNHMIYATYNRGFKAGAFSTIPPLSTPTNPEFLDAYEIGSKNTLFGGRATLNLSAFYYKYSDLQVTIFLGASAQTVNAAKAEIKGLDFDFNAQVTDNLRVTLGAEFLDHKFTDYPDGPILNFAPGGGLTRTFGDLAGNDLPYASDVVANGGLFYEMPTSIGEFDANVNATWNKGYSFEPSALLRQDSFWDINATLGLTLNNRTTRISIFGRNLANEAIVRTGVSGANPGGYFTYQYRPPRTYGIKLSQQF